MRLGFVILVVRFCHSERSEESEPSPTRSFAALRMTSREQDLKISIAQEKVLY